MPSPRPEPPKHASPAADLPLILERKRTLHGEEKAFSCRVLDRGARHLAVLFVSDRLYQVGGLTLPIGTVTFGHFWDDQPYNAYHWLAPGGRTIAYYFNICDSTSLDNTEFSFRDLTIDVLARPGGAPAVLDADELPSGLDPALRAQISQALASVLANMPTLARDLEARAAALWPRAFGSPRP